MTLGSMRIIRLEQRHIREAVDIHLRAFPNFFLTFLGRGFLKELYRSFVEEKSGIAWAAVDTQSGEILGVVVGTDSPNGFFRRLAIRRWWSFGISSLRALMKNPLIYKRLLRALAYRGDPPENEMYALLSSIAVAPDAQSMGVGKALLKTWIEDAIRRKCQGAYLTTDALDNNLINRFYQRAGWKLERTFVTPEGRTMNRYSLTFHERSA